MRRLKSPRAFVRDEGAAFAAMFGLMAVVLVALAGATVDYVSVQNARQRVQIALDAATLALQSKISTYSDAQLITAATNLINERVADPAVSVTVESVDKNVSTGKLFFETRLNVPTTFVSLIGINNLNTRVRSEATRSKDRIEVALVLDNSISMQSYNRMTYLKTAATNAVNILFDNQATQPDVFVGIVPFGMHVNVGSAYANASWMDTTGASSISWDNFDNDDDESTTPTGNLNRFALYDQLINESWDGCVEARPYPLDTNDTAPDVSNPDTLFVPVFQPDWEDGYGGSYLPDDGGTCPPPPTELLGLCSYTTWQYNGGWPKRIASLYTHPGGVLIASNANACSCSGETILSTSGYYSGYYGYVSTQTCLDYNYVQLSDRELQERICKYNGVSIGSISTFEGPNAGCLSTSISPLSNTKSVSTSKISAMAADSGTNIHLGAVWGFRVLSPTEPFTEGDDYDTGVSKVMILMTDGENNYPSSGNMNGSSYFGSYGFPYNARLGANGWSSSNLQGQMDTRLGETCTNIKAEDIEIFTIGLTPPTQDMIDMLTACATDASHAYFPSAPSELTAVFEEIAGKLAALRLAQ